MNVLSIILFIVWMITVFICMYKDAKDLNKIIKMFAEDSKLLQEQNSLLKKQNELLRRGRRNE